MMRWGLGGRGVAVGAPNEVSRTGGANELRSHGVGDRLRQGAIDLVACHRRGAVALAPRGWLLGRCLSLAHYVTGMGPMDGATAAGGRSCCLSSRRCPQSFPFEHGFWPSRDACSDEHLWAVFNQGFWSTRDCLASK